MQNIFKLKFMLNNRLNSSIVWMVIPDDIFAFHIIWLVCVYHDNYANKEILECSFCYIFTVTCWRNFLSFFFLMNFFFFCSEFFHTLKWNSHGFTCVPHPDPHSSLPLYPLPLGLPSAPGPSACLMHPTWAGDLFHPR